MPAAQRLRAPALSTLRSPPATRIATRAFRGLRVLTYHAVPHVETFRKQVAWLAETLEPVSLQRVLAWIDGGAMPARAVWVTFDDGDPTVVEHALPVLENTGIEATMFVCPGLIDADEPLWSTRVESADPETLRSELGAAGASVDTALAALKRVPDGERRAMIARLPVPERSGRHQLSMAQLQAWSDAGHQVGNHSWDHACLDRCSEAEQRRQVRRSDVWLRERVPGYLPVFAYPNGNWAPGTALALEELGYRLAVLHDHRFARSACDPYRISRLKVESTDDLGRFRSIVSGLQPALRTLVPWRGDDGRPIVGGARRRGGGGGG